MPKFIWMMRHCALKWEKQKLELKKSVIREEHITVEIGDLICGKMRGRKDRQSLSLTQ